MLTKFTARKGERVNIGAKSPYTATGEVIGEWTVLSDGNHSYWVALEGSKLVKIQKDKSEKYSAEYLSDLYKFKDCSYSKIWGYVAGEHDTVDEGGTLEEVLDSLICKASGASKFPKIYFGELIKSIDYTRKGKKRISNDAKIWNDLYLTREDTNIQARRILKDCSLEQIRTLFRLLGNRCKGFNERTLPTNELEKSNSIELLSRVIGACWWLSLKKKDTISPKNKWIKVIKRARGL